MAGLHSIFMTVMKKRCSSDHLMWASSTVLLPNRPQRLWSVSQLTLMATVLLTLKIGAWARPPESPWMRGDVASA